MSRLRNSGFTLVELMVALVVGLFLMGGVIQLFIGNKQTYRVEEGLSRIQENARFALDRIARDVRMTGYGGCVRLDNLEIQPAIDSTIAIDIKYSKNEFILGEAEIANDDNYPAKLGTDAVTLRLLSAEAAKLITDMDDNSSDVVIENNDPEFRAGDILAISDCTHLDIFLADSAPTSIQHAGLSKSYLKFSGDPDNPLPGSTVMRFEQVNYFISPNNSLVRNSNGTEQVIIDGAEDMIILYGIGNGSPNDYVPANLVSNWSQVLSLRISLLLASTEDNLTEEPQTIKWRGADYPTTADNRLRQVVTTTIALRNRLK